MKFAITHAEVLVHWFPKAIKRWLEKPIPNVRYSLVQLNCYQCCSSMPNATERSSRGMRDQTIVELKHRFASNLEEYLSGVSAHAYL